MGYPYMVPTKDQLQELIDNTTSKWIKANRVNGYQFTSKNDYFKFIFIPAAGWWNVGNFSSQDLSGYSLSSTIGTSDTSRACCLSFSSSSLTTTDPHRYLGYPIRPIAPPKPW